jgi:hypothetical protein
MSKKKYGIYLLPKEGALEVQGTGEDTASLIVPGSHKKL